MSINEYQKKYVMKNILTQILSCYYLYVKSKLSRLCIVGNISDCYPIYKNTRWLVAAEITRVITWKKHFVIILATIAIKVQCNLSYLFIFFSTQLNIQKNFITVTNTQFIPWRTIWEHLQKDLFTFIRNFKWKVTAHLTIKKQQKTNIFKRPSI